MSAERHAAIYVRISDDKAEDGAGVGRQEKDCRDLAARLGWQVGEVYTENDTSAFKRRKVRLPDGSTGLRVVRPAFRRMLDDVTSGAIDALIGYDLDRIARDPRDLEDLIDVVETHHIPTRAVTGSLDLSNDAGITMARVMVAVANKSSRDTARRVVRKQLELAEAGRHKGGGIRSFGYERDGMAVNEVEAAVLREIAGRVLDGQSLVAIAGWLNEMGVPPVRAEQWGPRSVHSVITKPRIAGLRQHRGEVVGRAAWPAVLDQDTWERVRLTLQERGQGLTNTMKRWLTGVLLCDKCGHTLGGSQLGKGRGARYWCPTAKGGCGGIAIDAGNAEATVGELIVQYLARPDVLAELRAATSSQSVEHARAEAAADEAQLRELADLWAARSITTAEYMQARRTIERRLSRWRGLVKASLPGAVRDLVGQDVASAWEALTPAQRREVARAVFPSGITVEPSRVRFQAFDPTRLVPVDWKKTMHDSRQPSGNADTAHP
jgi:site-specific DNA recombinase